MKRSLNRKRNASLERRTNRPLTQGRSRCDHLAVALAAFTRAIRLRRRLMKLAPLRYDVAVANRECADYEKREASRLKIEPILCKIYEVHYVDVPEKPPDPLPKNPRTRRVIEREEARRALWMELARTALDNFRQFQPHKVPSLSQIARLLEVGIIFGRLATGMETKQPKPEPLFPGYLDVETALEKIYGNSTSDQVA